MANNFYELMEEVKAIIDSDEPIELPKEVVSETGYLPKEFEDLLVQMAATKYLESTD